MERLTENKVILIVRETRLDELKARFNTVSQARFYVESLGGDFNDYLAEDSHYRTEVANAERTINRLARLQVVTRSLLPNFIFGRHDLAIALGPDGLVANTLKYLDGQPLVGVNPDPARFDGQLLPFLTQDLGKILPEVFKGGRARKLVTMAEASLNNGQKIFAVNDLFVGPKSHGSARYTIHHGGQSEPQSSSGVIVSTGLGSTGWFSSLVAGAQGLTNALHEKFELTGQPGEKTPGRLPSGNPQRLRIAWDADHLFFTVREPFPSRNTGAGMIFGRVSVETPLILESHMPERGVIFSDGFEADYLEFNSGTKAEIRVADRKGNLVA